MALILLFALLCWAAVSGAQPAVGVGCGPALTENAVSVSFPCTINAGSNRAVLLGIVLNATDTTSSMSFAGGAVQSVANIAGTQPFNKIEMYRQVSPPTGSQNFVFDVTGFSDVTTTGLQFTNVHQTTPTDTAATANGAGTVSTVNVTSAVGDLVVDLIYGCCADCVLSGGLLVGPGQTSAVQDINAFWGPTGMSTEAGAGTPVAMTWTCETMDSEWAAIGVSLNPAPAAAGAIPFRRRF